MGEFFQRLNISKCGTSLANLNIEPSFRIHRCCCCYRSSCCSPCSCYPCRCCPAAAAAAPAAAAAVAAAAAPAANHMSVLLLHAVVFAPSLRKPRCCSIREWIKQILSTEPLNWFTIATPASDGLMTRTNT